VRLAGARGRMSRPAFDRRSLTAIRPPCDAPAIGPRLATTVVLTALSDICAAGRNSDDPLL
jgi:hypothetical protein